MTRNQESVIEQLQRQIDDLQTRVAYQEDIMQSLNDVVAHQDGVINRLQQQLQANRERLDELITATHSPTEKPPPHY